MADDLPQSGAARDTAADTPPELPRAENLLAAIHVLSSEISRAFYPAVEARYGVTLPEWRVLLTLAHRPGASAIDIVTLWGMDKMAASRAVRRLEEAGQLKREPDPADRRRQVLRLTEQGQALYSKIEPAATARYRDIIAELNANDIEGLQAILNRMVDRIRSMRD